MICALPGFAQEDARAKTRNIRDLAKQGPSAIPQIAPYVTDQDLPVRLEAVKAIVQISSPQSLDPLVKATMDNDPEIQIRATGGLVNFYLPGYLETGVAAPFKKVGGFVKSKFTDTNDQVIDPYVQVRPDVIAAVGRLARGGANAESRANAARAAGILRGKAAVPDLIEALKSSDTDVNYELLVALGKIHDPSAGPAVALRLRDPVEKVKIAAIETTGILENRGALNQVRDALDRSKSAKVKKAALETLAMMPDPALHGVFTVQLRDKDDGMRANALEGLARLRNPADQPTFQNSYDQEKKTGPRLAAAFGLVYLGNYAMTDFAPLRYMVTQLNFVGYRGVAVAYLREVAREPAVRQALYSGLDQSPSKDEKINLAQVFGASGGQDSIPVLEKLSKDPDDEVDKAGLRALQNLRVRLGGGG